MRAKRSGHLRYRVSGRILRARSIPRRLKRSVAWKRLVETEPSRASAFAKTFSEDPIVTGRGPANGLTQELARTGKSLIRFADGEALLLLGKPTWFQLPEPSLRAGLFEIFFGYSEHSDYLLAIMGTVFLSPEELRSADDAGKLWSNNVKVRSLEAVARHMGARDAPVFDANAYRSGEEDPSSLWASAEQVVLVANQRVLLENQNRGQFAGAVMHHVDIPEVDVLPHLDRVCNEVRQNVRATGLPIREVPVIVAAGAVGKLVVARLMQDHRVLDVGAYAGWSLPRSARPSLHMKKSHPSADG